MVRSETGASLGPNGPTGAGGHVLNWLAMDDTQAPDPEEQAHDEDLDDDGALDATITVSTRHVDAAGHDGGDDLEVTTVEELDLDGDGHADIVATTTTTYLDRDHDGVVDEIHETTITRTDLDGDGVVDIVDIVATTSRDVDGDGVLEVVDQWEATGVDLDADGVIDASEITIDHVSDHVHEDPHHGHHAEGDEG